MPTSNTANAVTFETKVFIRDDCTDDPCLVDVGQKCKYTYDLAKGWDLAQLRGDCPGMDNVCRIAIQSALDGTLPACPGLLNPNTKAYLQSWKQKCLLVTETCRDSQFGCCPDGKTNAEGNFNQGCCKYATSKTPAQVLGGACSLLNPKTKMNFCGWEGPTNECDNGVPGDAKNADMMTNPATGDSFKCYCDKVCDITKDCCDGVTSKFCLGPGGFSIEAAPRAGRN